MSQVTGWGAGRAVVVFGTLLALPFIFSQDWVVDIAFFGLMYAVLAVAWNLIGGYAGYIWLGFITFFGLGAYALTISFQHVVLTSVWSPFLVIIPIGLGLAALSIPVALLLLRVRGATFAVVSLAVLFLAEICASNWTTITNGAEGMGMPTPPIAASLFSRPFYLAMLCLLAVVLLFSWYVLRSRLGLMLFAIRADEERARGLGVPTTTIKVVAFAASCGFAAMAGGIWAYYVGFIFPIFAFSANTMFATVMMVYLGGRGTLWGPLVGALLVAPAQEYLAYTLGNSQLYLIAYAAVFLLVIRFLPRGIVPTVHDSWVRRRARGAVGGSERLVST